jgi:hypothetical protein
LTYDRSPNRDALHVARGRRCGGVTEVAGLVSLPPRGKPVQRSPLGKEGTLLHLRKILAWIVFVSLSFAPWSGQAVAQTCSWQGTAPLCAGECGAGESEQSRARTDPGLIEKASGARLNFGSDCLTGTKTLCCKTPHATCRWSGTAPFCAGECKGNEIKEAPPEGSSSGASCWTGSKVYCCTLSPISTDGLCMKVRRL